MTLFSAGLIVEPRRLGFDFNVSINELTMNIIKTNNTYKIR